MDTQVVPIAFTEGADTRTQPKLVMPGKWLELKNLTLSEDGTPKTRPGHAAYATGFGNGLARRNDELLCVSRNQLRSVDQTQPSTIRRAGQVENFFVEKSEVGVSPGTCTAPDVACGDGYTAYAWVERVVTGAATSSYVVKISIVEDATGVRVVSNSPFLLVSPGFVGMCPRVVYAGGAFYFFGLIHNGATGSIFCNVFETSNPTVTGLTFTVVSGNVNLENYDVCVFNGAPLVVYGFLNQSVAAAALTRSGTTPSISASTTAITQAEVASASILAITAAPFDSSFCGVFVVHSAGGAVAAGTVGAVINAAITVTTAATNIDPAVPPVASACHVTAVGIQTTGSSLYVLTDQISSYGTADFRPINATLVTNTMLVAQGPTTMANSSTFRANAIEASGPQGPFLASKAIYASNGHIYALTSILENYGVLGANSKTGNAQCSLFLMDLSLGLITAGYPVAGALYGRVGVVSGAAGAANTVAVAALSSAPTVSTDVYRIAALESGPLQVRNNFNVSSLGVVSLDFFDNHSLSPSSDQLLESSYVAGGALLDYDGASITEHGFPLFPEGISVVVVAAGTGSITPGVHQMVAVYEWIDAAGNRHQSAPSPAVQFTVVNATDRLDILIPTLLMSNKTATDITVSVYMTLAAGFVFYRLYPGIAVIRNSVAASTVAATTGTFAAIDGNLAAQELLYTQPNQAPSTLPNFPPGPASYVAVSQNRVWFLAADQTNAYGYSQAPIQNVGLRFYPTYGGATPADGGKPLAIAPLDEKTIIFCERRIYVIYGTGPDSTGANNNFSIPLDIQSDVGCSDASSILGEVPGGIIFKSQKGWYMLGRDLSTKYIGAGVAQFDASAVLSATVLESTQECRFILEAEPEASSIALVYSYLTEQWSWFAWGENQIYAPACGAWWPGANSGAGNFVTLSVNNGLNADTPGVLFDAISGQNQAGITTSARTGWLHLAALEGFQRARKLYFSATADTVPASNMLLLVDYNDSFSTGAAYSAGFNLGALMASAAGESVDFRHKLRAQKCKSVSFQFIELGGADGLRTTGIQALAIEVGVKKGTRRLPAAQTVE